MDKNKKTVLIVDDDERNIFALKAVLCAKEINCITATGGIQALENLKLYDEIAFVLLDMMMPDIDGYELMGIIKKIPALHHVKLVAVTAQAMPGDKEKCIAAGANAYISKPIDIDKLMDIIHP